MNLFLFPLALIEHRFCYVRYHLEFCFTGSRRVAYIALGRMAVCDTAAFGNGPWRCSACQKDYRVGFSVPVCRIDKAVSPTVANS